MITISSFLVVPFLCNCILTSSASILTPLKSEDGLTLFKDGPNEFEYVIKRHHGSDSRNDDPDSKERRSSAGSSFIRFGRSEMDGSMEKANFGGDIDGHLKVNRFPRWKSPDIVIRFGRSGPKSTDSEKGYKRARNDLNFIRFGRNPQDYPLEFDLSTVCSDLMTNDDNSNRDSRALAFRLLRLCNFINNLEDDQRSSLDFLHEQANAKHD